VRSALAECGDCPHDAVSVDGLPDALYAPTLPPKLGCSKRRRASAGSGGMRRVYVLEASLAEHEAGADKGAVVPRKNEAETA
jgi:hypothetical protein